MQPQKLLTLLSGVVLIGLAAQSVLSEEENEHHGKNIPTAIKNDTHSKECGACHTAYQADFLPAASWIKIMDNLANHYGENAELGKEENTVITKFLTENAADKSNSYRGTKIMASVDAKNPPLRISELSYIVRAHHELPKKLFQNNPQVKSLSNCGVCHQGAARGNYDEDDVSIPNYKGRW